jgi:hypothetical protein
MSAIEKADKSLGPSGLTFTGNTFAAWKRNSFPFHAATLKNGVGVGQIKTAETPRSRRDVLKARLSANSAGSAVSSFVHEALR